MKRGTTTIVKAMLGSSAVQKIMIGASLVWQNWIYYTGILFNMTSRTSPSPFVVSSEGSAYPTGDHMFCNNSTDVWNPQTLTYCAVKIDLVNPVRMTECQLKINYGAYDYATFRIEASNDNVNWTQLWTSGAINTTLNQTLTIDSVIAYRYYRVRLNANTNTGWTWEKFIITKWYKQS